MARTRERDLVELLGHVFLDHVQRFVPFVHHSHAFGSGALGEFSLRFGFAKLMARAARTFVVGVRNRAGMQVAGLMAITQFNLRNAF